MSVVATHEPDFRKPNEVIQMIEVRNDTLFIDGHAIGNEQQIVEICDKANSYDELKATFFKEGDA